MSEEVKTEKKTSKFVWMVVKGAIVVVLVVLALGLAFGHGKRVGVKSVKTEAVKLEQKQVEKKTGFFHRLTSKPVKQEAVDKDKQRK